MRDCTMTTPRLRQSKQAFWTLTVLITALLVTSAPLANALSTELPQYALFDLLDLSQEQEQQPGPVPRLLQELTTIAGSHLSFSYSGHGGQYGGPVPSGGGYGIGSPAPSPAASPSPPATPPSPGGYGYGGSPPSGHYGWPSLSPSPGGYGWPSVPPPPANSPSPGQSPGTYGSGIGAPQGSPASPDPGRPSSGGSALPVSALGLHVLWMQLLLRQRLFAVRS